MQSTVEDAPTDSPVKVEVQDSTVRISSQPGIAFAVKVFGENATISSFDSASLRLTRNCANQAYTVNAKSASYSFTHNKAESIVVGYHKPGFIPFAPGKVYLVSAKVPAASHAASVDSQDWCIAEFEACDPDAWQPWAQCCQPGGPVGTLKCCNAGDDEWVCASGSGGICNPGQANGAAVADMMV